jgi:long-chain acyl-CoA synthetase
MKDLTPRLVHEKVARLIGAGGPFEVTAQTVGDATYRVFTHAPSTLQDIFDAGRVHGDTHFLVFDNERWSFTRFFSEVDALAAHMQHRHGIKSGDRVAIAMRNCPDWLIVFAAAAQLGAIVVPLNSWGSAEELAFTLNHAGAALLATDLPRLKLAAEWLARNKVAVLLSEVDGPLASVATDLASHVAIESIPDVAEANRGCAYQRARPAADDTAMLLYTSGSTGRPKSVVYRHIAVGQALMQMLFVGFLAIELGGAVELKGGALTESQLVTVPLFHATGLFSGFLVPCLVGQKVALLRKWDAMAAMNIIAAEKITMMSTVPAIMKDLLTHPHFDDHDFGSLSRVAVGGAATPADLPDLMQDKIGLITRSAGYGMTETASIGATMSGPVFDLKPLASGIPSPIIEMRFVDAEVQLRGVTVTPGYWHRDGLTREAFTADGWLRTGDLGHLDEDGFLHITGRIKEIVIRGGENISPIEVENVAYRHPAVKEVAVFGVPDDAMGEELAMVCYPRAQATLTDDQLRSHLRKSLPSFKVPKYIAISDTPLPRNASEKIHRLALRHSFIGSECRESANSHADSALVPSGSRPVPEEQT